MAGGNKRVNNVNYSRKQINLDVWLGPVCASADGYITVIKIQTKICKNGTCKDGIILINYFNLKFNS